MVELFEALRTLLGEDLEPIELFPLVILLYMLWRDRRQETLIRSLTDTVHRLVETNVSERLLTEVMRRLESKPANKES